MRKVRCYNAVRMLRQEVSRSSMAHVVGYEFCKADGQRTEAAPG